MWYRAVYDKKALWGVINDRDETTVVTGLTQGQANAVADELNRISRYLPHQAT